MGEGQAVLTARSKIAPSSRVLGLVPGQDCEAVDRGGVQDLVEILAYLIPDDFTIPASSGRETYSPVAGVGRSLPEGHSVGIVIRVGPCHFLCQHVSGTEAQ